LLGFTLTPPITTERLVLRARHVSDAADTLAYFNDPAVRAYLGGYPPNTITPIRNHLKNMRRESATSWTVTLDGRVIGECDLFHYVDGKMAHLGYILASPYWGRGLMREACEAVIRHGFEQKHLCRIRAQVDARNRRSSALLERLGFTYEACLPEADFGGRLADVCYYSLTAKAFFSRQSTMGAPQKILPE